MENFQIAYASTSSRVTVLHHKTFHPQQVVRPVIPYFSQENSSGFWYNHPPLHRSVLTVSLITAGQTLFGPIQLGLLSDSSLTLTLTLTTSTSSDCMSCSRLGCQSMCQVVVSKTRPQAAQGCRLCCRRQSSIFMHTLMCLFIRPIIAKSSSSSPKGLYRAAATLSHLT